ncbi:MAG: PaaI family thioesterase [Nitrososphaeria archaeon]|nr:PaaI family thioesterase [Conexivisphaerales archaeon]
MLEETLNIKVEKGIAEAQCNDKVTNILGIVHGGFIVTLLDTAMGSLIENKAVTVSISVEFLEPAFKGKLRAEGKVVRRGNDLIFTEGRVYQDKRLIAKGSAIYFILLK